MLPQTFLRPDCGNYSVPKQSFKVYPLGGVGEIGSNMTVFETEEELLIVDFGILFPYEDFFDINYLIVDSTSVDPDN